jgi:hypothetical protein
MAWNIEKRLRPDATYSIPRPDKVIDGSDVDEWVKLALIQSNADDKPIYCFSGLFRLHTGWQLDGEELALRFKEEMNKRQKRFLKKPFALT